MIEVKTENNQCQLKMKTHSGNSSHHVILTHSVQSKIPCKPKVTEFSFALSVKENVLRFDISMQDSVTVEVVEC